MSERPEYLEQFQRVNRWLKRLEETDIGIIEPSRSSDFYKDEMYTFFMNCHQLKDWIKNDESLPDSMRKEVEYYINQNLCLSYCADIANNSKHLKLKENSRSGKQITKALAHDYIHIGAGPEIVKVKYVFKTHDGIELDAFSLAKECVGKWTDFFKSKKLRLE